ncbi:MAG: hypothetical protein R2748_18405 [Bryobacterales bacterium]
MNDHRSLLKPSARSLTLYAAMALLLGLAAPTAQAASCPLKPTCVAKGKDSCWETDTVPSIRVVSKTVGKGALPRFSISWDNGTEYDVKVERIWESDFEGKELVRSSAPFASLDWTAVFDEHNCEFKLTTRDDPFNEFPVWVQIDPNYPAETLRMDIIVSGYQWVGTTSDLNLELSVRGAPGAKMEMEGLTTVLLGNLRAEFLDTAISRPGSKIVPVTIDADGNTIHIKYAHFGGTLFHDAP